MILCTMHTHTHTHADIHTFLYLSVTWTERERHPCHEGLAAVLRMRRRVCGQRCVRRVRGDGGVGRVRAEGQWWSVDVVVVHHRPRQHQLEQTRDTHTHTHNLELLKAWGKDGNHFDYDESPSVEMVVRDHGWNG